jgi:hypothetical protein
MAVREARARTGPVPKVKRPPRPKRAPSRSAEAHDDDELVLLSGGGRMILVAALLGTAFWALLFWLLFG